MATMDIIKLHGGSPANFLDVGGSAEEEGVNFFNLILKMFLPLISKKIFLLFILLLLDGRSTKNFK